MLYTNSDSSRVAHSLAKKSFPKRARFSNKLQEKQLFQELIDNIPDAVYFKDEDGRLVLVNKAHANGLNLEPEGVTGKTDYDFFPKEQADFMVADDKKVMETGIPLVDKVERTTRPDGSRHVVSTTKLPRKDSKGHIVGIMGITRDITQRTRQDEQYVRKQKRTEEELRELNMALTYAMPGISRLDTNGNYTYVNEIYARTMGYTPEELVGSSWQPIIHLDDQKDAEEAYQEMVMKGNGEFEARAICKDNSEIYKHVFMVKRMDEQGNFIGHHCFMRDITQRKKEQKHLQNMAHALVREKNKLEEVLAIEEGLNRILNLDKLIDFVVDKVTKILEANRCSFMLFDEQIQELVIRGYRGLPENIVQKSRIKKGDSLAGIVAETRKAVLVSNIETDRRFLKKNRSSYTSKSFLSVPIVLGDRLIGVINVTNKQSIPGDIFSDLDLKILCMISRHVAIAVENASLYRRLNYLTITDPLTHMHNYRYFSTNLDCELKRRKRYSKSLCLMMVDIDDFKTYNDSFGHPEGDALLKKMNTLLNRHVREVDIACRYAGDEFVVILPETNMSEAKIIAERIKKSFRALDLKRPMSVSIGIAECKEKMDRHDLVLKADMALYQAKKERRADLLARSH